MVLEFQAEVCYLVKAGLDWILLHFQTLMPHWRLIILIMMPSVLRIYFQISCLATLAVSNCIYTSCRKHVFPNFLVIAFFKIFPTFCLGAIKVKQKQKEWETQRIPSLIVAIHWVLLNEAMCKHVQYLFAS